MLRAFTLSLGQLGDPALIGVFVKSMLITIGLFAGMGYGLIFAANHYVEAQGYGAEGGALAGLAAALGAVAAAWLLFRAVAVPVMGLFADGVVLAVERRYYPGAAGAAKTPGLALSARLGLMSAIRVILINLLVLPLYALLLLTAIGPVIAFVAVNAVLLGRDLGEMVAVRHLEREGMHAWLRANRGLCSLLGLAVTGLFLIPIANFVAPIVGAAMATHLFHRSIRAR